VNSLQLLLLEQTLQHWHGVCVGVLLGGSLHSVAFITYTELVLFVFYSHVVTCMDVPCTPLMDVPCTLLLTPSPVYLCPVQCIVPNVSISVLIFNIFNVRTRF